MDTLMIEKKLFDMNSLLKIDLTYNFDILKETFDSLVKCQRSQSEKIEELENKLQEKEKRFIDLDKNFYFLKMEVLQMKEDQRLNQSNEIKEFDKNDRQSEFNRSIKIEIKEYELKHDSKENLTEKNLNNSEYFNNNNDISQHFKAFEDDVENLKNNLIDEDRKKDLDGLLNTHISFLKMMEDKFGLLKENYSKLEKVVEELTVKTMDFNIYDLLKGKTPNSANKGGSDLMNDSNKLVFVVENLENKVNKRFELMTEKIEKINEKIDKKNDPSIRQKTIELKDLELKPQQSKSIEETLKLLENKIINIEKKMKKDTNELKVEPPNLNKSIISDVGEKSYKDLNKKVMELDRFVKLQTNAINIDSINAQFALISETLSKKTNTEDSNYLKTMIDDLIADISLIKGLINQHSDEIKHVEDIPNIKKRVEAITGSLNNLRYLEDSITSQLNSLKNPPIDISKFTNSQTFNEFQKYVQREIDLNSMRNSESKKQLEDILLEIVNFVKIKDLKHFEEDFLFKFEELKNSSIKKFADKNETTKNIKFLDTQIKHIVDVYIKKIEKGDNWLLAKKPIGNFTCASCENFLGDLSDNPQYAPWNRLPERSNEKSLRTGNGFSRMIQMINFNHGTEENKKESMENSLERKTRVNSGKNRKNLNNDNIEFTSTLQLKTEISKVDLNGPKVTRIIQKKTKEK